MRILPIAAFTALAIAAVPTLAPSQSLGEVAAKEKEKKKNKPKGTVYSEDDVKRAGTKSGTFSTPQGPADSADAPKTDATATADGKKGEKSEEDAKQERATAWRKRLDKAHEEVSRLQKAVDDISASLGQSTSYYTPSRAKAMSDLDDAKAKLAQATQAVAELEDEGRRQGLH